jgi:hypothetical protein
VEWIARRSNHAEGKRFLSSAKAQALFGAYAVSYLMKTGESFTGEQGPGVQGPGEQGLEEQDPGEQGPGEQGPGEQGPGNRFTSIPYLAPTLRMSGGKPLTFRYALKTWKGNMCPLAFTGN